ncbi:hypothetical protein Tco_0217367 [Tanacetum coccineum]
MSSMRELAFFLGLQVQRKEDGIFISQDKYVAEILKKFNYSAVKYMIGSLMYLTASRSDIMFAVCACARFQFTLKTSHLLAVKRIFRYLKGKPTLGLWYSRDSPFELVAYTDSDYVGATQDRKSTTGGCQFLGNRLISWQCKKQTMVATSITEVEYVAAASCYLLTKGFDAGRFQYLVSTQRLEQEAIIFKEQVVEKWIIRIVSLKNRAANPSKPSPISYFYNANCDNISTPSTTYTIHLTKSATIITNPSEPMRHIYHNHDIFYDGDDDEELFPDEVKRIQQILERNSFDAITPDFLITDSLNPHHFNVESGLIESLLNRDILIVSSPKIDSLLEEFSGELAHIDLISLEIEEADFDPEEENSVYSFLGELLTHDSLSLTENESFYFDCYYVPSSPRPPEKPPDDDDVYFVLRPETGVFYKSGGGISGFSKRTYVMCLMFYPLPTLSPMFDTLLPFSLKMRTKFISYLIGALKFSSFFLKASND